MSKTLLKLDIIGFVFVSVIGTLAHFVFEWSGNNTVVGLFCPINESPWEHLKLIFFPYLIWTVAQYFIMHKSKNIFPAKFIGVFVGMVTTLSFFYTYTGIIGKNIDLLNIASFFIGVFCAFAVDYTVIKSYKLQSVSANIISIILFAVCGTIFILFTFAPPIIPLFKDPITSSYGI